MTSLETKGRTPRVVVAMSGGVDSSVAAALMVQQGYEVIGIMMRLWAEDGEGAHGYNRCCTPDQMTDAGRVADKLGIPFYVLDTQKVFRGQIVQFFMDQYARGVTPDPCLECNRHIRFEWLLNHAMALDADYLATGHYARIRQDATTGCYQLLKGVDEAKDQSYVLSVLGQKQLARVLFPVGEYSKPRVRELAAELGLGVASKGDSQDLCFLSDGDYRRFLREHTPASALPTGTPGPILRRSGEVLGQHTGLIDYTIGQRKGLGIAAAEPLFVIATDPARNALIVGTKDELGGSRLVAHRVNWISGTPPAEPIRAQVKIRYKAQPVAATVTALPDSRAEVVFDGPLRDITPGQGAVFYGGDSGEICLGGGIIARDEH